MGNGAAQSSDDQDRLRLRIDIAADFSSFDAKADLLAQKFLRLSIVCRHTFPNVWRRRKRLDQ